MVKLVAVITERMSAHSAHVVLHDATTALVGLAVCAALVADRALSVAHPTDGIVVASLYLF